MSDKKIIIGLIICILLIMIIISMLVVSLKNAKQPENIQQQEEIVDEGTATLEKEVTLSEADNKSLLFTVEKYIKKSLNIDYNIYIWKLYIMERISNETYFTQVLTNKKEILYLVINIDNNIGTYSVEKISKEEYENSIDGTVDEKYLEDIRIRKNGSNDLEYIYLTDEETSAYYMNMIKDLIINYPEAIYQRLDEQYRKEKFGDSFEKFSQYSKSKANFIDKIKLNGFTIDRSNGETKIYICKDMNNNVYTIKETTASDFTLYLDDYTVYSNEFIEKYNNSKDNIKVSTNIDRFIKIINNKDYDEAYKILNEQYKNTRFPTKESYQQFLSNEFYSVNSQTIKKMEQQGEYYLVTFDITPGDSFSSNIKTEKVAMKLGDGMDFEMSIIID